MNREAKIGLIVLGVAALGTLLALESARTPNKQFDPRFVLIMVVIGIIIFLAAPARRENGPHD